MPQARIYQPTKNPMQSGKAKAHSWILEFLLPPQKSSPIVLSDASVSSTLKQVKISFQNLEDAMAYAQHEGITVDVVLPNTRKTVIKAYADNFRHDRVQ